YYLHARLLLRLAGADPLMDGSDWLALGRYLLRTRRRADGWRALRNAAELADGPASALARPPLARFLTRRRPRTAADRPDHAPSRRASGGAAAGWGRAGGGGRGAAACCPPAGVPTAGERCATRPSWRMDRPRLWPACFWRAS